MSIKCRAQACHANDVAELSETHESLQGERKGARVKFPSEAFQSVILNGLGEL